jgi:hypothetical protein
MIAPLMEALEERRVLASIAGSLFADANGNGLREPAEAGRPGGLVYLDTNGSGQFDGSDPLAVANAQGQYQFTGLGAGTYAVRQLIGSTQAQSYPAPRSQFDIALTFASNIPETMRQGVREAAARWMEIIIGDLPNVGEIDDIEIHVESRALAATVLAVGGPTHFRGGGAPLPYRGTLAFDEDGLDATKERAYDVALHEVAHALGFGTLWKQMELVKDFTGQSAYVGRAAFAMYKFAVDPAATGIPLEPDPDDPTDAPHWASSWAISNDVHFEVMNAFVSSTQRERYISTITVGAMHDLGYAVDYSQADLEGIITAGEYEAVRTDVARTSDGRGYVVTVTAEGAEARLDFGTRAGNVTFPAGPEPKPVGTISGLAFIDANGNRRKDRNEKNLRCTIFFDSDKDGVLDAGEPRIKLRASSYQFTNVPVGTHKIGVVLPKGFKLAPKLKAVKVTVANLGAKLNVTARRA